MGGQGAVGDARRIGLYPVTQGPAVMVGTPVEMRRAVSTAGVDLTGLFERTNGDIRTQMFLAKTVGPWMATVWSAKEHLLTSLDYQQRIAWTARKPKRSLTRTWTFGSLSGTWSEEHKTILGQDVRKIVLREAGGQSGAEEVGYCWVSEALDLVLDEKVTIAGALVTWQVTELELREPGPDILQIPAGFTETRVGLQK